MSGQYFGEARNVEISTTQYIEDSINASWSEINTVKGYPSFPKQSIPVVSVELGPETSTRKEIGTTNMNNIYNIIINVHARSNGQRLDLAQFVKTLVETAWTYYVYSQASGNPGTLDSVAMSKIVFVAFTQNNKIQFFDEVDFYDRYRHIIGVDVRVV